MKSKQVLSVEQMEHLQELGLDTSDGSMCFEWNDSDSDNMVVTSPDADTNYDYYHETYTLQDILDKLPRYINVFCITYKLCVEPLFAGPWAISYQKACLKHSSLKFPEIYWMQPTRCCAGVLKTGILKLKNSYESKNKSNRNDCRG